MYLPHQRHSSIMRDRESLNQKEPWPFSFALRPFCSAKPAVVGRYLQCARICHTLGIKVSGDTVIRLLLKRYDSFPAPEAGDVIGVDDFAYKKRHTYGTIIVDGKTHEPVILLDGRNGDTLREWLKHNKNIKVVTRDRASAYAKVIAEELPDAMQVADCCPAN